MARRPGSGPERLDARQRTGDSRRAVVRRFSRRRRPGKRELHSDNRTRILRNRNENSFPILVFGNHHAIRPIDGHGQPYHGRGLGCIGGEDDQTGKDGLPAACSSGEAFFLTGAAGGQNLYLCTPDNAWTLASGGARSISITDMAPVTADSGLILVVNPSAPIHLTRVYCAVQGSGSVAMNLDKRAEGTIGADSGAPLLGPDLTATTSGANTSTFLNADGQCGGTTSCAVAAHTPVVMTFTTVTGAPTALNCSVDYAVD